MTIKDWLEGLSYKLVQGSLDVEVNEVVYDSRKAAPGAVFVCMKGTKIDSHDFIPQVTEAGVKVLVTEHPVETPEDVTVVETKTEERRWLCYRQHALAIHPGSLP